MNAQMIKKIMLAILTALPLAAQAQSTIKGNIEGLKSAKIYLSIRGENVDSSLVDNGQFTLKGTCPDVTYCLLQTDDGRWKYQFWLGPNDQVSITAKGNTGEILGAPEEDLYQLYCQAMNDIWNEEKAALAEADKALDAGDQAGYDERRKYFETTLRLKEDSVFIAFAKQHPDAYAVMNHIYNCRVMEKYDYPRYYAMFQLLDKNAFKGQQWDTLLRLIETDRKTQPGNPFPATELTDVYDTKVSTANYKGKYLLVVFGQAVFKDYQAALPVMKELYNKYQSKGYEQLDIVFADNKESVIKIVSQNDIPWTVASDWKNWHTPLVRELGIDHLCQNFLLDKNGNIIARNVWGDDLRKAVENCMKN